MATYSLGPSRRVRFPGVPGFSMRIDDALINSVVFLGVADDTPGKGGIHCIGTGFLVAYEETGYLVTAKHVAKDLHNLPFRLRINKPDGASSGNLDADEIEWNFHPDPNVDLAAILFHMRGPTYGFETVYIPEDVIFDHVLQTGEGIGIGDLCYTVGLFRVFAGKERNLPVVHAGNLALIPGTERIPVRDWDDPEEKRIRHVEGYLVEMSTLTGLSGSPVFVRPALDTWAAGVLPDQRAIVRVPRQKMYLLGVWQASWDAPASEVVALEHGRPVTVPVGMGVVVPSVRIKEVLDMPKLKRDRELAKSLGLYAASPASVARQKELPDPGGNPEHREDFNRLVGAASKKRQPADKT